MERQVILKGVAAVALVLASGCAATRHGVPLNETVRSQVKSAAVVPASFAPRVDFSAVMHVVEHPSTGEKSEQRSVNAPDERTGILWKQVAEAAWAEAWHPSMAAVMILGPVPAMFMTDAPIGVAKSIERNRALDGDIARMVPIGNLQHATAEAIAAAGARLTGLAFRTAAGRGPSAPEGQPDYRAFGGEGMDVVLEASVNDVGFISGPEDDPAASLFLHVGMRAIRTADGSVHSDGVTIYISRKHLLSTWLKDDGKVLRYELAQAQSSIATRTIEKLFLQQDTGPVAAGINACMLTPYYPEEPGMRFGEIGLTVPLIDSLQPLFRWEAFPRPADKMADAPAGLSSATDVGYDLQIWRTAGGYPDRLVYERTGLPVPTRTFTKKIDERSASGELTTNTLVMHAAEHRLESTLEPSTDYFWSVRARFKVNGRTRVTRWSSSRIPNQPSVPDPCEADHVTLMHSYRFRTPDVAPPAGPM